MTVLKHAWNYKGLQNLIRNDLEAGYGSQDIVVRHRDKGVTEASVKIVIKQIRLDGSMQKLYPNSAEVPT